MNVQQFNDCPASLELILKKVSEIPKKVLEVKERLEEYREKTLLMETDNESLKLFHLSWKTISKHRSNTYGTPIRGFCKAAYKPVAVVIPYNKKLV